MRLPPRNAGNAEAIICDGRRESDPDKF